MFGGCPLTLPVADYCLLLQEAFSAFPRPSRPEQPLLLSRRCTRVFLSPRGRAASSSCPELLEGRNTGCLSEAGAALIHSLTHSPIL